MTDFPHIWTRRPKILEPKSELIIKPSFAGYWKLEAIRPDGRKRVLADWFPNIIVDTGLNVVGSASWFTHCVVGTDNTAPVASDAALGAQVASTGTIQTWSQATNQTADSYTYARVTFRFSAGAAAGNLTEIGVRQNNEDVLFSRALILDGSSNPTTITILSDEILDATYEIREYPPLVDVVTTMVIAGSATHDVVLRAAEVDQWQIKGGSIGTTFGWVAGSSGASNGANLYPSTSVLGAITSSPSGAATSSTSQSTSAYSADSLFRDFSYTWNTTAVPSGGAAAAKMGSGDLSEISTSGLQFQISFDPVIPKTSGNNLVLNFRTQWARRTI